MAKELNTKEGRSSFLKDYLDDLLLGINDSYGPILLDELEKRLEKTISDFNGEIEEAFSLLKKKQKIRKLFMLLWILIKTLKLSGKKIRRS